MGMAGTARHHIAGIKDTAETACPSPELARSSFTATGSTNIQDQRTDSSFTGLQFHVI
jgi:hypothetical protein